MLRGAVACAAIAAFVYVGAFHADPLAELDRAALSGFLDLQTDEPFADPVARTIVHLLPPVLILGLSAAAIAFALWRRDLPHAMAAAATVILANVATQLLQALTWVPRGHEELAMEGSRWPSGHSAGVTALAFAVTMAAPPRARRIVAVVAGLVALVDCLSILVIHWHFPSDVVGGVALAAAFGLASWAGARAWIARGARPPRSDTRRAATGSDPLRRHHSRGQTP